MSDIYLIEVFRQTIEMCNSTEKLKQSICHSIQNQIIYWEEDSIPQTNPRFSQPAKLILSGRRSFEAASQYAKKDKRVAVLNFGSSIQPGGGVRRGTKTQEESLCRLSTLYPALSDNDTAMQFYRKHLELIKSGKMGRENRSDCIFTPSVVVFRNDSLRHEMLDTDDWYSVDIITCAAPDQRYLPNEKMYRPTDEELFDLLRFRIEKILSVAAAHDEDVLILGAFGCGAFGNPPEIVARAFESSIEKYCYSFESIEFAIYHTSASSHNYTAFQKINRIKEFIPKQEESFTSSVVLPSEYRNLDAERITNTLISTSRLVQLNDCYVQGGKGRYERGKAFGYGFYKQLMNRLICLNLKHNYKAAAILFIINRGYGTLDNPTLLDHYREIQNLQFTKRGHYLLMDDLGYQWANYASENDTRKAYYISDIQNLLDISRNEFIRTNGAPEIHSLLKVLYALQCLS